MTKKPSEGSQSFVKDNLRKVLLIGIGNEFRCDDRVGLEVARQIRKKQFPSVIEKEESGDGARLMEAWQGYESVILIDAISSGATPGTIFKIDASKKSVPAKFFRHSTHAFSIAEAIELARVMKMLPSSLLVYGIEGANFRTGINISHVVQESAKHVVEQILEKIQVVSQ
jgi:hydrogenase maturation protease